MSILKYTLRYWIISGGVLLSLGILGAQTNTNAAATPVTPAATDASVTSTVPDTTSATNSEAPAVTSGLLTPTKPVMPQLEGTVVAPGTAATGIAEPASKAALPTTQSESVAPAAQTADATSSQSTADTTETTEPPVTTAPATPAANDQATQNTGSTPNQDTPTTANLVAMLQRLAQRYPQLSTQLNQLIDRLEKDDTAELHSRLLPLQTVATIGETEQTVTSLTTWLKQQTATTREVQQKATAVTKVDQHDLFADLNADKKATAAASNKVTTTKPVTKEDTPFKLVQDSAVTETTTETAKLVAKTAATTQKKQPAKTFLIHLLPETGEQVNLLLSLVGVGLIGSAFFLLKHDWS
ncbi:LPXTG cell wall anchor domain-containing protein [Loigolactobacillus zhaoyuanensis]|uniref:LPXTG cell wall anchor domain-containing protein n=1 Tax=Loigolactobacillus zhaoyuanensis TaxID=2486017 RepID=A0ABW8UDI0_9LACO